MLKNVVYLCKGYDGCCVSVSSCKCCMFVSCVHVVAVPNPEFCMTCSLLMLIEDKRDDHM